MKKAVIFDLDGTLIDTPRGIVETFMAVLKNADPFAIRATIGMPLERAFSCLLAIPPENEHVADAVKQYQTLFKEIVLPKAKHLIFPGVVNGLHQLKSQEYRLAVATSKIYVSAEALLKAAELWGYFDCVVGADQVKQPKPHPEMGELVMQQLNVLPKNTVMVGDTTHDILMGNSSGMQTIAVTYGVHELATLQSAKPTHMVNTFDEVVFKVCGS